MKNNLLKVLISFMVLCVALFISVACALEEPEASIPIAEPSHTITQKSPDELPDKSQDEVPDKPQPSEPLKHPDAGDIITFGGYDWIVLDVVDDKALIISENILESRAYNEAHGDHTWAESDIREFLNGGFLSNFSPKEKEMIVETPLVNNDNPWFIDYVTEHDYPGYRTPYGGDDTKDYIFLLSLDEVMKYFGGDEQALERPDSTALWIRDENNKKRIAQHVGGYTISELYTASHSVQPGASFWWLRSPGNCSSYATFVSGNGNVNVYGSRASDYYGGVRPALWLDLGISPVQIHKPKPTTESGNNPDGINVGDIIEFGGYDWYILDASDGKVLVLSVMALESRPYHKEYEFTTWAKSDMRRYLNGEFINRFSEADRARIAETEVINNDNPWYDLNNPFYENYPELKPIGGDDTVDHIFLLSIEEVVKYFGDSGKLSEGPQDSMSYGFNDQYDERRLAQHVGGVTGYIEQYWETVTINAGDLCSWWLRTPGGGSATHVGAYGDIYFEFMGDSDVYIPYIGVRPAMWLFLT